MPHGGNKRFKGLPMIAFDGKDRCLVNLKKGTVACYKYKRSAGANRDGRCMFIAEPLYADMMKWSACGLSAEDVTDQASWQAYLSLTMSSIEGTIRLPKKAILIMPDAVSTFETDAVSVEETADHDLTATEKKVRVKNKIWDGQVCTTGFAHGEMVLCARSPHITMGNLYLAQNAHCYDLLRYFNLNPNIICVNAIESNIQQRLNGCDYDSDSMLVTDDELIIAGVTGCYDILKVPVCKAEPVGKTDYENTPKSLAELDQTIAKNKIGEIVNLSQFLNCLLWDGLFSEEQGAHHPMDIYHDICILAVLSGMEIDKAKRLYSVDSGNVNFCISLIFSIFIC